MKEIEYENVVCKECKWNWNNIYNGLGDPSYCYMFEKYLPNCQLWKDK